jgi:CheY-like chemotaxis protein
VPKLLLLDDDEAALAWMRAALESRGHRVATFTTARAALEALESIKPDLIVSDVLLPEIDGLAFARLVRQRGGTPLMFLSVAKKQAEAVLAGAIGYLQKPASAMDVRAAVERRLGEGARRNTVLIVDDNEDLRELYRAMLEPRFVVLTAENGREALDALRAQRVDLAIVDMHMPVMNGVELVRAVRNDPALESLPVIVQTSDRAALRAPIWGPLCVARVMDKSNFLDWLEAKAGPLPIGRPTV